MPRGVYERKQKGGASRKKVKRRWAGDGFADMVATMRAQKIKAEDRVVALGTAIEALEALDER
jgi:hypothetical protein